MKHIPGISDRRNRIATIAIVIVLALASIAGVVAVSPVAGDAGPTQADADLQVELEDVSAEPGETVVVPLSIDSSSEEAREILGYDFGVSWNQSVLELVEVRDTGFADPVVNTDEPGSVRFNAVAPDGVETPIEPVELVFEVDADADSETSLSFDTSVSEISETDGRDTVEWIDGSVSVSGGTDTPDITLDRFRPGDVIVGAGEDVSVEAVVENVGTADGSDTVELVLEGDTVQEETVDVDAGESTEVAFQLTVPEDVGTYTYGIRVGGETHTDSLVVETPVDGLSLRTQVLGERSVGQAGVLVQGIEPVDEGAVAVVYGESSIVAGMTEIDADADSTVAVPLDDLGGIPGTHAAVVVDAGDDLSVGEPLPEDVGVIAEASGEILEANLTFEDQAVSGTVTPIDIAEATLRDGGDDVEFIVAVETAGGQLLGTSEVLEGQAEDVVVQLDEPLPDTEVSLTASIRLDGADGPLLPVLDGDRLRPVRDNATVEVELTRQDFDLAIGDVPAEIEAGDTLEVPVTISNTGDEPLVETLALEVNGDQVDTLDVDVSPDQETVEMLTWQSGSDDAGSVQVTAALLDRSEETSVTVESQPDTSPTETQSPTATEDGSDDQPGLGLAAAVIAIALLAGAYRRRS